jgi:N-acetylmuramoyl-L-alanine amidase
MLAPLALLGAADADPDRFDAVVIDAGHGGEDEGARGPRGVAEKTVVFDIAQRLAARLRAQGLRVVLTRERDSYVPLEERTAIANDARADLFLSIHANAARSTEARGIESYFLSLQASDEGARELAQRENAAFRGRKAPASEAEDPLLSVLGDMMATEHQMESDEFSRLVHASLAELDGTPPRGVKQAPFVVLMGLQMPASLIEIGFITNPDDARWLRSPKHREGIARAIATAIRSFGRRYDARRGRRTYPGGS